MKKFAMIVLALVAAPAAFAAQNPIPLASEARVVEATVIPKNGGINPEYTRFEIHATVEFSNSCMETDELVAETAFDKKGNLKIRVLEIHTRQRDLVLACPAIFSPVQRTILVHEIWTDTPPAIIKVNGVRAEMK